jgi:2-keto-4-pentenoate hydratase
MMRTVRALVLAAALATTAVAPAGADCGVPGFAAAFDRAYAEARPLPDAAGFRGAIRTLETGYCLRDEAVGRLAATGALPIGWKVAATSGPAQQAIGTAVPLVGVLARGMLLQDGSSIRIASGARLIFEADLLVRVADDSIIEARTVEEAAAHIAAVVPFIEVPDMMLSEGEPISAPLLVAMNTGARWGVAGAERLVADSRVLSAALGTMRVRLGDATGRTLVEAPGAAILGHPLNALLFLLDHLRARGATLAAGDLVSLGSFGRFQFPSAGMSAEARYDGLPGGPMTVSLRFE